MKGACHSDSAITCLVMLARFHGLAAQPEQIKHHFGEGACQGEAAHQSRNSGHPFFVSDNERIYMDAPRNTQKLSFVKNNIRFMDILESK